jgi:hypothetical protein
LTRLKDDDKHGRDLAKSFDFQIYMLSYIIFFVKSRALYRISRLDDAN